MGEIGHKRSLSTRGRSILGGPELTRKLPYDTRPGVFPYRAESSTTLAKLTANKNVLP